MGKVFFILMCPLVLSLAALAQDHAGDTSPVKVGYAIVTSSTTVDGLIIFETFGRISTTPSTQATVLPGRLLTKASFFATADITFSNNVGFAAANPGEQDLSLTITLRAADGSAVSQKVITVRAHQQIARFVSELFSEAPGGLQNFNGTIGVVSDYPVALVGLRFAEGSFSTIPITKMFPLIELPIPELAPGIGGPGAVILPQFAADGGWASEIVAINTTALPVTLRVDIFKQDGTPLITSLNQQTASTFENLVIAPGGVLTLAP